MELNMRVTENLVVSLGEIKEELLFTLDENGIKYSVPFDKTNADNIKETIIQIPELKIEVSVENDIVTYIKSGCNKYNILGTATLGKINSVSKIEEIKNNLMKMYDLDEKSVFIEKINTRAMEIIMIIKDSEGDNCRVHIMSNTHGEVFIYNIRYAK